MDFLGFIAGLVLLGVILLTIFSINASLRTAREAREKASKENQNRIDELRKEYNVRYERMSKYSQELRNKREASYREVLARNVPRNVPRTSSGMPVNKRQSQANASTSSSRNDMAIIASSSAQARPAESYRNVEMHESRSSSYRNTDMDSVRDSSSSYNSSSNSSSSSDSGSSSSSFY